MISRADTDEAVVGEVFVETCGYGKAADAVGQTIEFLAARTDKSNEGGTAQKQADEKKPDESDSDEVISFFGLPLEDTQNAPADTVAARRFRIAGVLGEEKREGAAQGGPIGLAFSASTYIPLPAAHDWLTNHRNPMGEVALALARQSGQLNEAQREGNASASGRRIGPAAPHVGRQQLPEPP